MALMMTKRCETFIYIILPDRIDGEQRQIKPGDYVKLETSEEGYVTDISWRNTTIRALPIHPNWAEIEDTASEELARGFYGETDAYDAMLRAVQRTRDYFNLK